MPIEVAFARNILNVKSAYRPASDLRGEVLSLDPMSVCMYLNGGWGRVLGSFWTGCVSLDH